MIYIKRVFIYLNTEKILHYTEEPKGKKKKVKDDDSSDADDLDKKFHKDKMKDRNDAMRNLIR